MIDFTDTSDIPAKPSVDITNKVRNFISNLKDKKKALKDDANDPEIISLSNTEKKLNSNSTLPLNPIPDPGNQALSKIIPNLRLVVSNPNSLTEPPKRIFDLANTAPFKAIIKPYNQDSYSYIMIAEDTSHFIKCKLPLIINEVADEHETSNVICYFPKLDDDDLFEFIGQDETLYGILLVRFQMKILEQLLLFCAEYHAEKLIIVTPVAQFEAMDIYHQVVSNWQKIPNSKNAKVMIPADCSVYDFWIDFMEKTKIKFMQNLWADQRANHEIQKYLKTHVLLEI